MGAVVVGNLTDCGLTKVIQPLKSLGSFDAHVSAIREYLRHQGTLLERVVFLSEDSPLDEIVRSSPSKESTIYVLGFSGSPQVLNGCVDTFVNGTANSKENSLYPMRSFGNLVFLPKIPRTLRGERSLLLRASSDCVDQMFKSIKTSRNAEIQKTSLPTHTLLEFSEQDVGLMDEFEAQFRASELDCCWLNLDKILRQGTRLSQIVADSVKIIEEALDRYTLDKLSISFNGGKDCTVLLFLFAAVVRRRCAYTRLQSLYVVPDSPFEEVEEFVDSCVDEYRLDLCRVSGPMRVALQNYLDCQKVEAIFIGNRRSDPYSEHLKPFDPTNNGWPHVMRVHPILDWDYSDIWDFLREMRIPYCSLYDQGYTSIGGVNNTRPNHVLANKNRACGFNPAYMLKDTKQERMGRL